MKPERKEIPLTDDERVVHNILNKHHPIDLIELKNLSGLSNKKWDKAFKGLVKKRLANYNSENNMVGLIVQITGKG